jgi:hypothetical protein
VHPPGPWTLPGLVLPPARRQKAAKLHPLAAKTPEPVFDFGSLARSQSKLENARNCLD